MKINTSYLGWPFSIFSAISKRRCLGERKASLELSLQGERLGSLWPQRGFRNCQKLKTSLDFFVYFFHQGKK
ncbi:hypothetical protein [Flavobacterium sp.]|uniref:hypothetical protein n=1 Tax=Flavobacterium sp. TaxID=239 RepID=UPI0039E648ED